MVQQILRLPAVKLNSGVSKSTLHNWIHAELWTRPVQLGPRTVGWPAQEVDALNKARIAGKTPDEIRALVRRLEDARKEVA